MLFASMAVFPRGVCFSEVGVYKSAYVVFRNSAVICKYAGLGIFIAKIFEVSPVVWGRFKRAASLISVILRFTEIFAYFDFSCLTVIMCVFLGMVRS